MIHHFPHVTLEITHSNAYLYLFLNLFVLIFAICSNDKFLYAGFSCSQDRWQRCKHIVCHESIEKSYFER